MHPWLVKHFSVRSRRNTKELEDHWRACDTTSIVTVHRPLQARCDITLVQEAHDTANPKGQSENHTAQHELETPASWRDSLLGRQLLRANCASTHFGFFGHPCLLRESPLHATVPNTIRHFGARAMSQWPRRGK